MFGLCSVNRKWNAGEYIRPWCPIKILPSTTQWPNNVPPSNIDPAKCGVGILVSSEQEGCFHSKAPTSEPVSIAHLSNFVGIHSHTYLYIIYIYIYIYICDMYVLYILLLICIYIYIYYFYYDYYVLYIYIYTCIYICIHQTFRSLGPTKDNDQYLHYRWPFILVIYIYPTHRQFSTIYNDYIHYVDRNSQ